MDCTHSWHSAGEHHLTEMMDLVHYILNIIGGIITNVKRTEGRKKTKMLSNWKAQAVLREITSGKTSS